MVEHPFAPQADSFAFPNYWTLDKATIGLCDGMAFAALDYGIAGQHIPAESGPTDQLSPWLRAHILRRMVDSLACSNLARVLAWMVIEHRAPFASGKRLLLRWTLAECFKLKDLIAQHGAWPIALIGETKDPCHNHQVLAYWCAPQAKQCTIQVYDVNYPCTGRELDLDLHGPSVEMAPDGRNDSWHPLRGLFCEEHSPIAPPQTAEIASPTG